MDAVNLNIFQRLARSWESVHPYNAAQVLRIQGNPDRAAAEDAWAQSLRALGLGRVRVAGEAFRHEVLNGEMARYPVRAVPADTCLAEHLTRELNRPFEDPDEPPFRPFLLQHADSYSFGVVYQHWVADSVSIRLLLQEWFLRMHEPGAVRAGALQAPREGYWKLFGARRGNWRIDETLLALFRSHMRHRRVLKVKTFGREDYPVRVSLTDGPDGLIERLCAFARGRGVKVNDVLLAAAAEACHRHVPHQARRRRRELAVGSIVDLRRHASADLTDTFGLFLGFTSVFCKPEELRDFDRLLRSVAAQTRVRKEAGVPQASMLWMMAALATSRFVPPQSVYHFYRKELPMAGGVSNVNLNETWAARYHPAPLLDYLRVSPTGPMVPVVFSTTTLGRRFGFAMTYRPALLGAAAATDLAATFSSRMASLARD